MTAVLNLSALALRQLVDGACTAAGSRAPEKDVEALAGFLNQHNQRLTRALQASCDHAWKALEIILAGDTLWERCQAVLTGGDSAAFRQQIRSFLDATMIAELAGKTQFRKVCWRELLTARQAGVLSSVRIDLPQLAQRVAPFARLTDANKLMEAEWLLLKTMANAMRQATYSNLAWLLTLQPEKSCHLLASAVRFFFRRELEGYRELLEEMPLGPLQGLTPEQLAGFTALAGILAQHGQWLDDLLAELNNPGNELGGDTLDLKAILRRQGPPLQQLGQDVLKLLEPHRLESRELRPGDSLSVAGDAERQLILATVARVQALPEPQRKQLPALFNAIGKLQVVAGEFEAAQDNFQDVAAALSDRKAQAEAYYNAYQAGLERRDWMTTLAALQRAATLDPKRFAPFPMDKYEPERILGAGGFGVVFLCRNRHSGSRVVVKALRTDGLERDVAEVFREAQVVEELDHPAIIRLRDCDYTDAARTRPYLVMDYFDGVTLGDYVEQHGPLTPEQFLRVAVPAARALQAAHARGLLHRDVKPANLLVRREGADWWVKLIDFGLALTQNLIHTTVSSSAVRLRTTTGASVAGTLDYAAPEQMGRLKEVEVGPYSDVYSFGKTCYLALLGTPDPDDEEKEELPTLWRKLLSQCTARTVAKRLPAFTAVLERLAEIEAETGDEDQAPAEDEDAGAHGPDDDTDVIAEYTEAIRRNPKDGDAYYNRGVAYANAGDHERAIADYTQAIRLDPSDAHARANRGNAYRMMGAPDRAIADYDAALELDPNYARAYTNRGGAHEEMGDYERAIEDYIEAINLDDSNSDAYNALTWLWSTCPEDSVRNGPKAVEYATAACELTGWTDPNVLDTLAAAYAECGEFDDAVRWQKKALAVAPAERRAEFQFRVKLYQGGTPYREKSGSAEDEE